MPDETYETTEEYKENYRILLDLEVGRKEMLGLLKIAQPEKVLEVQKAIAEIDECIEQTEEIMELERDIFLKRQEADKHWLELAELADKIEPELRAYLAEHNPEQLEIFDAMLSDDGKTH